MRARTTVCLCTLLALLSVAEVSRGVYEVRQHNGTPTLFMEGEPYFAPVSIQGNLHQKIIQGFGEKGLHIYSLLCHFADSPQEVIERMATVVKWNPNARFIIRIGLLLNTKQEKLNNPHAVRWFTENPPSENGENQVTYQKLLTKPNEQPLFSETPSVASEKWLRFAMPIYRDFIETLEKSPYGERIAIYWPAYHEGNYSYSFGGPVFFSDYSPAMIGKFRLMLMRKYQNDLNALRSAWQMEEVDFATAEPPSPLERLESSDMSLRNPRIHQRTIDFEQCLNKVITEYILNFLSETKRITNRRKLTGTYACYIGGWLSSGGEWRKKAVTSYRQAAGHLDVLPYYESPDVDLIGSPHSYIWRGSGEPIVLAMAHSSWKLRDKLFFWEDDTRTSVMALFDQVGSCRTVAETNEVLKRNFGYNLVRGYLSWIPGHYFGYAGCDDPDIMAMLGKCREIGMKSLDFMRDSDADVALVIDDTSVLRWGIQPQAYGPLTELHHSLSTAGVSYDNILLADMANPKLKNYKLYVFLDSIYLPQERRRQIQEKLSANGASAVWFYAPAYVGDEGYSLGGVEEMTGIRVEAERRMDRSHIRMTSDSPLFQNVKGRICTCATDESRKPWGPQFFINDQEAMVLGVVNENGKPGLALKKRGNVTHFYSVCPYLDSEVIRDIARYAGVHIYAEKGDYVAPGRHFLVLHAAFDGEHEVRLPRKCDIYEVYDEVLIAENAETFKLELKRGETKILFLGDRKLWRPGRKVNYTHSDLHSAERQKNNMHFFRKPDKAKCIPLDLSAIARNYGTDPNLSAAQPNIPVGEQMLANVPFTLLDPAQGPVCLLLRGGQHPQLPNSAPDLPVGGRKIAYFYFLHQAGWMNRDYDTTTMEYIVKYADGTETRVPIHANAEIADSVNGGTLLNTGLENRETKIAKLYFSSKRYPTCALYAYRWKNPHREKAVAGIGFSSEKNRGMAVPAVYAITLELAE